MNRRKLLAFLGFAPVAATVLARTESHAFKPPVQPEPPKPLPEPKLPRAEFGHGGHFILRSADGKMVIDTRRNIITFKE